MKKTLLMSGLASVLLLGACSGEEEAQPGAGIDEPEVDTEDADTATSQSEASSEAENNHLRGDALTYENAENILGVDLSNASEDLMEFASNTQSDLYVDIDNYIYYKKLKAYTTEKANENGTLNFEHEGYEETINMLLIEDDQGTVSLAVIGEEINGTDRELYSGLTHDITTDTMQQLSTSEVYGKALGGMYQPNTRHQGLVTAELEFPNELPTEVNVQFEDVFFA